MENMSREELIRERDELRDELREIERELEADYSDTVAGRAEEINADLDAIEEALDNDERCPGCGSEPGDGITEGCNDEAGCGYFRTLNL